MFNRSSGTQFPACPTGSNIVLKRSHKINGFRALEQYQDTPRPQHELQVGVPVSPFILNEQNMAHFNWRPRNQELQSIQPPQMTDPTDILPQFSYSCPLTLPQQSQRDHLVSSAPSIIDEQDISSQHYKVKLPLPDSLKVTSQRNAVLANFAFGVLLNQSGQPTVNLNPQTQSSLIPSSVSGEEAQSILKMFLVENSNSHCRNPSRNTFQAADFISNISTGYHYDQAQCQRPVHSGLREEPSDLIPILSRAEYQRPGDATGITINFSMPCNLQQFQNIQSQKPVPWLRSFSHAEDLLNQQAGQATLYQYPPKPDIAFGGQLPRAYYDQFGVAPQSSQIVKQPTFQEKNPESKQVLILKESDQSNLQINPKNPLFDSKSISVAQDVEILPTFPQLGQPFIAAPQPTPYLNQLQQQEPYPVYQQQPKRVKTSFVEKSTRVQKFFGPDVKTSAQAKKVNTSRDQIGNKSEFPFQDDKRSNASVEPLTPVHSQRNESKTYEGIPQHWHQTIKVRNPRTMRVKLYFKCRYKGCASVFKKSCNLRDHFRKHTGQRPFICPKCKKCFTQGGNLGRHLKNVHKVPLKSIQYVKLQNEMLYTANYSAAAAPVDVIKPELGDTKRADELSLPIIPSMSSPSLSKRYPQALRDQRSVDGGQYLASDPAVYDAKMRQKYKKNPEQN